MPCSFSPHFPLHFFARGKSGCLPPLLKWTVKWRGGEEGGRPLQQTFWQGKSCSGTERARGGGGGEAVFRWLFKGDELNMTVVSVMAWGRRRRGRRKVVLSPQTARRQLAAGGGGGGAFREILYSCRDYCSVMRSWKRQPLSKRRTSYGFFHILPPFFATRGGGEQKKRGQAERRDQVKDCLSDSFKVIVYVNRTNGVVVVSNWRQKYGRITKNEAEVDSIHYVDWSEEGGRLYGTV